MIHRKLIVLGLIAVVVVPVLALSGWIWWQVEPPTSPGHAVTVSIRSGWSTARIGDALESKGVIGSSLVFQVYSRTSGSGPYHAGTFKLRTNLGARDAARALDGKVATVPTVGVLPGMTLRQVGDSVGGIHRFSAAQFVALATDGRTRSRYEPAGVSSVEGMLWPDSYQVDSRRTEPELLTAMVTSFDQHASAIGLDAAAARLGVTPYQVVVVASIVQREAKLDSDRPLIAAVVYNRLRARMPLQLDSTVRFAVQHSGPLTSTDFASASPYNTYKVTGLPPTPIATVSATSLRAAMAPAGVPYEFFVKIDADGKQAFATTFAQHEKNVAEAKRKGLL